MGALAVGLGATVKVGRDFLNTELLELGRSHAFLVSSTFVS